MQSAPACRWAGDAELIQNAFDSKIRNPNSEIEKMDTHSRLFRVRREDIAYFKFIIESYEGMAVVRTKDPHEAVVELMVAPGWEKDVEEVLESLGKEISIEKLSSFPR
jgi:Domain of unknown function (DUF4911)